MTPKEKAKKLVYKYSHLVTFWDCYCDEEIPIENRMGQMKKCALIAVDAILESHYFVLSGVKPSIYNYWQEVKQEIEKL